MLSPGRASAMAREMAAAGQRSGGSRDGLGERREDLIDDGLGILGPGIVGGHDHKVGLFRGHPAISGRLPRSRSPPQPNTTINRPGVIARRRSQAFARASSLWA